MRVALSYLIILLPTCVSADFFDIDPSLDSNERTAEEAAQCSGYSELMKQLVKATSRPEDAREYLLQTAELQTVAALIYVNDLGLSDKEAMSKVYDITESSANKIAQNMIDDFARTQDEWTKQCEVHLIKARKLLESTGLRKLLQATE